MVKWEYTNDAYILGHHGIYERCYRRMNSATRAVAICRRTKNDRRAVATDGRCYIPTDSATDERTASDAPVAIYRREQKDRRAVVTDGRCYIPKNRATDG